MRIRTFTAPNVSEAMAQVRRELGEEAIIVSAETLSGGRGARVLAAVQPAEVDDLDADFAPWTGADHSNDCEADPEEIRAALEFHGIPRALSERILRAAKTFTSKGSELALAAALDATLSFQPLTERPAQRPLLMVGPAGMGKTLSAARLLVAARNNGASVIAITCDTQRAGGVEQLDAFCRVLGVELALAPSPQALGETMAHSPGSSFAIIDTAGASPFVEGELTTLRSLISAVAGEPLLVMAAGIDPAEAAEQASAFARIGCRRMVITRLDVSRRFGALLTASDTARLAIAGVGISSHAADPLSPLNPLSLARLLLAPAAIPSGA